MSGNHTGTCTETPRSGSTPHSCHRRRLVFLSDMVFRGPAREFSQRSGRALIIGTSQRLRVETPGAGSFRLILGRRAVTFNGTLSIDVMGRECAPE